MISMARPQSASRPKASGRRFPFGGRHGVLWAAACIGFSAAGAPAQEKAEPGWRVRYLATWDGTQDGRTGLKEPQALAVDPSGFLYIADTGNQRILKWAPSGAPVAEIGGFGWGRDQFDRPVSIWAGNGLDAFVADQNNHRIVRYDKDLNYIAAMASSEAWPEAFRFGFPRDAVLGAQAELFCLDGENRRVVKLDVLGQPQLAFGGIDAGEGRLVHPVRLQTVLPDRFLVSEEEPACVRVFDTYGNFLFTFGSGVLAQPAGMAHRSAGWILVADRSNGCVHVFRDYQPAGRFSAPTGGSCEPVDAAFWNDRLYILDAGRRAVDLFDWTVQP